jgi:hypothetical protein
MSAQNLDARRKKRINGAHLILDFVGPRDHIKAEMAGGEGSAVQSPAALC